jgi:hypothetical protein
MINAAGMGVLDLHTPIRCPQCFITMFVATSHFSGKVAITHPGNGKCSRTASHVFSHSTIPLSDKPTNNSVAFIQIFPTQCGACLGIYHYLEFPPDNLRVKFTHKPPHMTTRYEGCFSEFIRPVAQYTVFVERDS